MSHVNKLKNVTSHMNNSNVHERAQEKEEAGKFHNV